MGNVCSSGQKKKKDSVSEKSDDSPAYQAADNECNNTKIANEKLAPLADPESVPDVQFNGDSTVSHNSGFIPIRNSASTKTNGNRCKNVAELGVRRTESNASGSTKQTVNTQPELNNVSNAVSNVLSLLQGKPPPGRKIERDKNIVLYVLADNTTECKEHKRIIHNMQNELEQQCRSRGFDFMITDIHEESDEHIKTLSNVSKWAQSPLEAEGGHEEAANALSEISRHTSNSYLVPIIFLGSSLGQPMLPLTIENQDFVSVLNVANDKERLMLKKWYTIDDNYQPMCHRLKTEHLTCGSEDEENTELEELLQLLLKLCTDDLKDSYLTTVVEQEINNTVLISQELAKRCIWVQCGLQYVRLPDNPSALDSEVFRRISKIYAELKLHLSEKNIIRVMPGINILEKELMNAIQTLIERIVNSICEEHQQRIIIPLNTNGVDHILVEELYEIARYSKLLGQNAANFDVMNDVKRYICDNTQYPLVVFGSIGCGKSVLTSKIMENIHRWKPEAQLVLRYAQLSVYSADLISMLGSIANQMSVIALGCQLKCEHSMENYAKIIQDILYNSKQFFVIVIDGLDELQQENSLQWLPINLNSRSKIILTVTDFSNTENPETREDYEFENISEDNMLRALLENGIPQRCFLRMAPFTQNQWLEILSSGGGDFYAANGALKMPFAWKQLHGKTIFHAKSLWWLAWLGHFDIEVKDINEIEMKMIEVFETKFTLDHALLLLLMVSLPAHGICEIDCLGILQKSLQLDTHACYRLWCKFCWLMGPLLLHLKNLRITDRTLRSALRSRYAQKCFKVHQLIRDYFDSQQSSYVNESSNLHTIYNVRKFCLLPYHHISAILENDEITAVHNERIYKCRYYSDLSWIMDKVTACGPAHLLHDILTTEWLGKMPNGTQSCVHINFLKDFLKIYMHELRYDGSQFMTLFKYYLKTNISDDSSVCKDEVILSWLDYINEFKLPFLEICNASLSAEYSADEDNQQEQKINKNESDMEINKNSYDLIVNLPQNGYFVATVSTERDEICIWDVLRCQRIRTLKGIPQPTAICPVANFEAAVLCRREIKVFNLDEGKFKVTLKGVMNQKMPYFGLHDQNHLVCLSRNRMYVNLMNLESGDCVTTFKAGEDRFLNSLLVSGDGRILVCGDETQKPFPLLVWHLTQRKLLYDLRIPHHDFITTLSAITYEGSYVCVVAKELNEPTPNFIVVYDLQSGTLFKKWKPNYNTVSLAISQLNACVIAGLENAKILIWDLVTGNCRSTLIGHNAPVTFLKLDPLGKVLMSRDNVGRDKAIRIWELATGKLLAAYKPPGMIVSCEILPNGSHIVLALKKSTELLILTLKNFVESPKEDCYTYGNQDNNSKIFNLNLT